MSVLESGPFKGFDARDPFVRAATQQQTVTVTLGSIPWPAGLGFSFVNANTQAPAIYIGGQNPVPGPQLMATVSADYLSVDDTQDTEGLQALGIVNDSDDAFAFYALSLLDGKQPGWLSVRNVSDPQIADLPASSSSGQTAVINRIASEAGTIYGIYQYCTTLNSAFACWAIVAGM